MKITPTAHSKTSLSTWEVRDNKNKLVGKFDANKDKTCEKYDKLIAVAKIKDIANDLFDVRQRIKDLIHGKNEWQTMTVHCKLVRKLKTHLKN